uniref:SHSP domain-containing protein n=1 Tax=Caenorhabditis japonica TaxID=281687 RepID=A0A8R1HVZ8_CAEJA
MSVYRFFGPRPTFFGELMERERHFSPFAASDSSEITNTADKFSVNLNVSQFKPEELKINLDGRKLTIQGDQVVETKYGNSKKSFTRILLLPDNVDFAAVASNLTEDGKLSIEAPKKEVLHGRSIPIQQLENAAQ